MATLTKHQAAALNYKEHISLTANAGSGKTFVLSKRYVEIASKEKIHLRNIAAITFTDKAAGELYKKIADEVDERHKLTTDLRQKRKLENIRRQLVSANISTIHSFCIDILREFPVESNIDANFTPIDSRLSDELIEISVEETIKEMLLKNDQADIIKNLIRIFASKRLFAQQLTNLIEKRKNVLLIKERIYSKDKKDVAEYFHLSFIEYLEKILIKEKVQIINVIERINAEVKKEKKENETAQNIESLLNKLKNESDTLRIVTILNSLGDQLLTKSGTLKKAGYATKGIYETLTAEISFVQNFFKDIIGIDIPENHKEIEIALAEFGLNLLFVFNKALDKYEKKKKQNGYLDFEDILLITKNLLKLNEVKQSLSDKYKYLMIDEYQDTNEIQYEIFLPILDDLKLNNLFIVGDEKQSIYMFRDAELEVFARTKQNISDITGSSNLLNLPDSFRMAPAICLFTNYLFKNLFKNPVQLYNEVEHNELVCGRGGNLFGSVELILASPENDSKEIATEQEAFLVAKKIKLIKKTNPDYYWKDIAILCRKRNVFSELENVLSGFNIPYSIIGGKGFYQRQIVYDIFNYISFLLNKNNDAALTGILRSPFFSFSDGEIYEFSLEKGETLFDKLKNGAIKNDRLISCIMQLEENIVIANKDHVIKILRKIFSETPYLTVIASRVNGEQELANIEKLMQMTLSFISQGFKTLFDYVYFLRDAINKTEDEGQATVGDDSDSVKIMTVHQSKGLEYSVVILFRSNEKNMKDIAKSKQVIVSKEFGLLTKIPLDEKYSAEYSSAPVLGVFNYLSKRKNLAEIKRLFYVAVTRAKDHLILSGTHKNFNFSDDSFMGMLMSGLSVNELCKTITVNDNLTYLVKENDTFINKTSEHLIDIPVITNIEEMEFEKESKKINTTSKELLIQNISDIQEGEIISATKIAVYNQCPLKYKLTYDFGYSELFKEHKKHLITSRRKTNKYTDYDFNRKEEVEVNKLSESKDYYELSGYAEIKGSIIHEILQFDVNENNINEFIKEKIKMKTPLDEYSESTAVKLAEEISDEVKSFYSSKVYNKIKKFNNFHNEQQLYVKKEDYFLFGIIDKLLITDNEIIIVDYKTDNIQKEEISKRSDEYMIQLKFYALLVSKYFQDKYKIKILLIFTRHPDYYIENEILSQELVFFEDYVNTTVLEMRNSPSKKNKNHCSFCSYSIDKKKCIID